MLLLPPPLKAHEPPELEKPPRTVELPPEAAPEFRPSQPAVPLRTGMLWPPLPRPPRPPRPPAPPPRALLLRAVTLPLVPLPPPPPPLLLLLALWTISAKGSLLDPGPHQCVLKKTLK